MKRLLILFLLIFPFYSFAISEDFVTSRVRAHLQIKDYSSAYVEALKGIKQFPHHAALWEVYIQTLAKMGKEKEMFAAWNQYEQAFPDHSNQQIVLETMAWGVIEHASQSSSPITRLFSLVAAMVSQDAKGIKMIEEALSDKSGLIRTVAIELAAHLRDDKICDEVFRLFQEEKFWKGRIEAISAVGKMRIEKAKPLLIKIIADHNSSAEEKAAAIESLVILLDTVDRESVWRLTQSDRAGLRLLACEIVAHFDQKRDLDLVIPLLNDSHPEVRVGALYTIGILRTKTFLAKPMTEYLTLSLSDPDPIVAITAAWAMTLNDPIQGQKAFKKWMVYPNQEIRLLAGGALVATGKYGYPLTIQIFNETDDSYLMVNMAIGMIGQRKETERACHTLYACLNRLKERWMWNKDRQFKFLAPSKIKHDENIPQYPEAVNQLTRLEILNLLAIMKYPKAQEGIRQFLQERKWGISSLAVALLLTEGDESAIDIVHQLLDDANPQVRIQSALILALWGQGSDAISTLENAYEGADREMKERILEGIAHIASSKSLPFLVKCLQDPSQSIRIIAATGILECLYH